MNREDKIDFLIQFLKKNSTNPDVVIPVTEDLLERYVAVVSKIDGLEDAAPELFGEEVSRERRFALLGNIIEKGCVFNKGSPPTIKEMDGSKIIERLEFWKRDHRLEQLPGCDYLRKPTSTVVDAELAEWVVAGREKLRPIVESFLPDFNMRNTDAIERQIKTFEGQLKVTADGPGKVALEKKIVILNDLNKINQLSLMNIPLDGGGAARYCKLAEAAGGVTEKVSLVRRDRVATQLPNLIGMDGLNFENYLEHRDAFKLSTQAIIKLPKHGKILEVQREAMALNVSRMLGLDTTSSTMISHNGKPALFVPFADIKLLKEFATGKTFTTLAGAEYSHYSTINPVGEGLHPDEFMDDFGIALALFYLCSDTDAVGGYNQNKAIRDNISLFIFDQVIMDSDKLGLDSRLSMQPISTLTKHTRHDQGRNRTVIEDSSIEAKFASIQQLRARGVLLEQYCDKVGFLHDQQHKVLSAEIKDLKRTRSNPQRLEFLTEKVKEVAALRDDAWLLGDKIKARIAKIDQILPKNRENLPDDLVMKTLVLEKLLNHPKLFADDGRPFRNPWTNRNTLNAQSIIPTPRRDGFVTITFNKDVPLDTLEMIRRWSGSDTLTINGKREVTVSAAHLRALSETVCSPEHSSVFRPGVNYLDPRDLAVIQTGYQDGHRGRIIGLMNEYIRIMNSDAPQGKKLEIMGKAEGILKDFITTAKDKGFGLHVLKKMEFDMHTRMLEMIPVLERPANLTAAFNAAAKLDQIKAFNEVVRVAIANNKVNSHAFTEFLQSCIDKAGAANDHVAAKRLSAELASDAQEVLIPLKLIELDVDLDVVEDVLSRIDPRAALVEQLEDERQVMERGVVALQDERDLQVGIGREEGPPVSEIITI